MNLAQGPSPGRERWPFSFGLFAASIHLASQARVLRIDCRPMSQDPTPVASVRSRPHFVIVGAGFAGISAAKALKGVDIDITIIDKNNFHTFQPLLYQVTTATLDADEVSETLPTIFAKQPNVTVRVDEVTTGDLDAKTVTLKGDGAGETISYDYLMISAGAKANFFGIEGMEEHSWPLYTLADALRLRANLTGDLDTAAAKGSVDPADSTVVIVGGGPTGVEMAGALIAMEPKTPNGPKLRVVLVEALPRLLPMFSEESSQTTLEDLRKRGVEVLLDTKVQSADANGVSFASGERIETRTIVWGAGVRANPLGAELGLETGRGGAILVDENLRVKGRSEVFAAGDNCTLDPPPAQPIPPVCPTAMQMGKHVGRQVKALVAGQSLSPFKFWNKGSMAVIGKGNAVVELTKPKVKLSGVFAWLMWLAVHNFYLDSMRNRARVVGSWLSAYIKSEKSQSSAV